MTEDAACSSTLHEQMESSNDGDDGVFHKSVSSACIASSYSEGPSTDDYDRDDGSDSAVCSDASLGRGISFSIAPPNPKNPNRSLPVCDVCHDSGKKSTGPNLQRHQLEDIARDAGGVEEKTQHMFRCCEHAHTCEQVECLKSHIRELEKSKNFHLNLNWFLGCLFAVVISISIWKR